LPERGERGDGDGREDDAAGERAAGLHGEGEKITAFDAAVEA
jgi:hypothetical protein